MKQKSGKIRNIGPTGERWLAEIGIRTLDDLEKMGSVAAYLKLKESRTGVTILALYSLEAALWDLHWNDLPGEIKDKLHAEVGYVPKPRPPRRRTAAYPDAD